MKPLRSDKMTEATILPYISSKDDHLALCRIRLHENDAAFNALSGPESVALRRIDIDSNKDSQSCRHDGIHRDKLYLVLSRGRWAVGYFSLLWYGWNFNGLCPAGLQLNALDMVFETDLPKMPVRLVEAPPAFRADDEDDLPEAASS